ncbi:hypothetical protein LX15_001078 [Streptoalloteichus tenebrarius]|uniref:Uncharacterized protein n=1 Tax=Streptoalloteichus tenebrarius (strain ATCC 17920 / DSM 40477 / JCM 4838 / CBS 697.72 / NBRC 16177 / NCIMB 11028 / NRRL B-12390 / A12253. 1 / ISP 5477) TaxID=1933 RepID=A0ABT1HPF4_STRSD|nr:hypothetical protein [Streptoalloteichus tenebrarius]MCP2257393.1 hypothetical protein [Streptoalloteichus tenebrarius]BFE98339.1 hypothetical protein GCM10020241_00150 [Streptoalloteichus tenebrarius]
MARTGQGLGPTEIAGSKTYEADGYRLRFYPDLGNPERQDSEFYWMPDDLYLERGDDPETGDFAFRFSRFAGEDPESGQVDGGLLTFTLAGTLPPKAVEAAQQQLYREFVGHKKPPYWGILKGAGAVFSPMTFQFSHTTLSNVFPRGPNTLREDPWFWQLQGADTGSISATTGRSYRALFGHHLTQVLYRAVREGSSSIVVNRTVGVEFTAPVRELRIKGQWRDVSEELVEMVGADGRLTIAELRRCLTRLTQRKRLTVEFTLDGSVPDKEEAATYLRDHSDALVARFAKLARQAVLDPTVPRPAALTSDADGPATPWGRTWKVVSTMPQQPSIDHVTSRPYTYSSHFTLSTSFESAFAEMRKDPDFERKYVVTTYLSDWSHCLRRVFRPVIAWDNPAVEYVAVQCGYPNENGVLDWQGRTFPRSGSGDKAGVWVYEVRQKHPGEVDNPPAGWESDRTFVRRSIHLVDSTTVTDRFCVVHNEVNHIEVDPEPHGTLFDTIAIDVSTMMARHLDVVPIYLDRTLDESETVDLTMEVTDPSGTPLKKPTATFRWTASDQDTPRRWILFPAERDFVPCFRYRATLRTRGATRVGPWIHTRGNGALPVLVPDP